MSGKIQSCIFCDIISRQAEASIVYEDDLVIAFHDAFPLNPGHTLIVPKVHVKDISELAQPELLRLTSVAQEIAKVMLGGKDIECTGVNLLMANGSDAGQEVMHAHLHILPRKADDGIRFSGPKPPKKMSRKRMNWYAKQLYDALAKK